MVRDTTPNRPKNEHGGGQSSTPSSSRATITTRTVVMRPLSSRPPVGAISTVGSRHKTIKGQATPDENRRPGTPRGTPIQSGARGAPKTTPRVVSTPDNASTTPLVGSSRLNKGTPKTRTPTCRPPSVTNTPVSHRSKQDPPTKPQRSVVVEFSDDVVVTSGKNSEDGAAKVCVSSNSRIEINSNKPAGSPSTVFSRSKSASSLFVKTSESTDSDKESKSNLMKRSMSTKSMNDLRDTGSKSEVSRLIVGVRIRPLQPREYGNTVTVDSNEISVAGDMGLSHSFNYDYMFPSQVAEGSSSQEEVYQLMAKPLLDHAYQGYNACLFAYGQTGSGKTFSMMGPNWEENELHENSGIIPRFCNDLLERANKECTSEDLKLLSTTVEVSYLEVYNEKIHDLLVEGTSVPLKVREHPTYGPYVVNLSKHKVESFSEIMRWIHVGNRVRATAATESNEKSSRSHSLFSIILTQTFMQQSDSKESWGIEHTRRSQINLVDLAGSERIAHTIANSDRIREGVHINRSLLTLGKVITALVEGRGFVPYRDSVLTFLLKESLGGNSRTRMLATVSPCSAHLEETLSTLRYAKQARAIISTVRVNEAPHATIIRELRAEIERLRELTHGERGQYSLGTSVTEERGTAELAIIKEDMRKLKSELFDSKDRLKTVSQTNQDLTNELDSVKKDLKAQITVLQADLEICRQNVTSSIEEKNTLNRLNENYKSENEKLVAEIDQLKSVKSNLEEQLKIAFDLRKEHTQIVDELKANMKKINTNNDMLNEELHKVMNDNDELKKSLEKALEDKKKLEAEKSEIDSPRKVLEQKRMAFQDSLKAELEGLKEELSQLKFELMNVTEERDALNSKLETANQLVNEYQKSNEGLESQLEALDEYKAQIAELETKLDESKSLVKSLEENSASKEQLVKTKKQLKHLKDKFDNAEKQLKETESQNAKYIQEIEVLKIQLDSSNAEIKNKVLAHQDSEQELERTKKQLESLNTENILIKSKIEVAEKHIQTNLLTLKSADDSINEDNIKQIMEVKKQVNYFENENKSLNEKLDKLEDEYKECLAKLEARHNWTQFEELIKNQFAHLELQLKTFNEQLTAKDSKLDELQNKLRASEVECAKNAKKNSQNNQGICCMTSDIENTFKKLHEDYKNSVTAHHQLEISTLKTTLKNINAELKTSQSSLKSMTDKYEMTKSDLVIKVKELTSCEAKLVKECEQAMADRIAAHKDYKEQIQQKEKEYSEQKDKMLVEIAMLKSELDSSNDKLSEKSLEIKQLRSRIDKLEDMVTSASAAVLTPGRPVSTNSEPTTPIEERAFTLPSPRSVRKDKIRDSMPAYEAIMEASYPHHWVFLLRKARTMAEQYHIPYTFKQEDTRVVVQHLMFNARVKWGRFEFLQWIRRIEKANGWKRIMDQDIDWECDFGDYYECSDEEVENGLVVSKAITIGTELSNRGAMNPILWRQTMVERHICGIKEDIEALTKILSSGSHSSQCSVILKKLKSYSQKLEAVLNAQKELESQPPPVVTTKTYLATV